MDILLEGLDRILIGGTDAILDAFFKLNERVVTLIRPAHRALVRHDKPVGDAGWMKHVTTIEFLGVFGLDRLKTDDTRLQFVYMAQRPFATLAT